MDTLNRMFKRILILAGGGVLGFLLTVGAARVSHAWGLFPNRELNQSSAYVREVLQMVNESYVDSTTATYDKLVKTALHGMVEALDPHSEFLESREYSELEEQLSGDFSGIGIQVEMRKGRVVVIAPIANSPGERAGIQRGDEILQVDGKGLDNEGSMEDVIERLRGAPQTQVTVELLRPSSGRTFQLTLQRELIKLESVRTVRMLAEGTGYILLTEFSDHTGAEFGRALDQLVGQGMVSLVLDLRNNPGGLLDAAVEVAEPFFRKGELIVSTRGRKPADSENLLAEAEGEPLSIPLAVLINGGTASAAEIVTGALKDTGRAIIVGERSFGKGSVQSIFPLKNGEGLRLTTARYYTPGGLSIHEKGITPHVELVMSTEDDSKLRVQQTRADITAADEFKERFGFDPIEDRQLQAALDVLKGMRLLDQRRAAVAVR